MVRNTTELRHDGPMATTSGGLHGAGGIGGLLAAVETGGDNQGSYWFLYDGNGNVGQVLKASDQSIAARYEYDPYGNQLPVPWPLTPGPYASTNPIRFSTKWLDTELAGPNVKGAVGPTGLYYYGFRYYSPRLGRWLNRDPIGEAGGLDVYGFVYNNATIHVDPQGQFAPVWGPRLAELLSRAAALRGAIAFVQRAIERLQAQIQSLIQSNCTQRIQDLLRAALARAMQDLASLQAKLNRPTQ